MTVLSKEVPANQTLLSIPFWHLRLGVPLQSYCALPGAATKQRVDELE
jgi:hypothetical protein